MHTSGTPSHTHHLARELSLDERAVHATAGLLDDGATVPFITRYRKEATGGLDEVAITAIRDGLARLRELDKRRTAILASLEERGLLTDELRDAVLAAETLTVLEDLYLPYRPKRRTRATIAREKGLEPLALLILGQGAIDPDAEAAPYIDAEKGVATIDEALAGARDIIAEMTTEDAGARESIRALFGKKALIASRVVTGKEEAGAKYRDYFAWEEPLAQAPSHRILAMRRGEKEEMLILRVTVPDDEAAAILDAIFVTGRGPASEQVRTALRDGLKRLLAPAMETEFRLAAKERADAEAVRVFADNLRHLLLAPPLGGRRVLAIDPGFRTGCKITCLDAQGNLVHNETVYPHLNAAGDTKASARITELCTHYGTEIIAIGNGTAGRETETLVRSADLPAAIMVVMVNESGASVYSTSEAAREEFPDRDATVRGAVSIGRRLMDPLAELVKIDPRSIGVGQYQHDVDQQMLRSRLDDVVMSCVNSVGVEVNTASRQLLGYVSGIGPALAGKIITYRTEHGPFRSRHDLLAVPRLGAKAFEQAAGFLRIRDGADPLDASAVHPESYPVVESMARDLGCAVFDLLTDETQRRRIEISRYVSATVGMPTLTDIMDELARPGRDPRAAFDPVVFSDSVRTMEDLKPGMRLPGIVTNVTAFGAFVDIGVHQDGLVHISRLAEKFVKNPADVVKVQQKVTVTVMEVDITRRRISLSLRKDDVPKEA